MSVFEQLEREGKIEWEDLDEKATCAEPGSDNEGSQDAMVIDSDAAMSGSSLSQIIAPDSQRNVEFCWRAGADSCTVAAISDNFEKEDYSREMLGTQIRRDRAMCLLRSVRGGLGRSV